MTEFEKWILATRSEDDQEHAALKEEVKNMSQKERQNTLDRLQKALHRVVQPENKEGRFVVRLARRQFVCLLLELMDEGTLEAAGS